MDSKRIRVVVAEDSQLCVKAIVGALEQDRRICVEAVAHDGRQVVELAASLKPDVITMGLSLPLLPAVDAIRSIMAFTPTPILVITEEARAENNSRGFEALRCGALDLFPKHGLLVEDPVQQEALRQHVKLLASVPVVRHVHASLAANRPSSSSITQPVTPAVASVAPPHSSVAARPAFDTQLHRPNRRLTVGHTKVIGIVASTGGPAVVASILASLPENFPAAIGIVQHLAPGFASHLASWLRAECALPVDVGEDGLQILPGHVIIAPDEFHLVADAIGVWRLVDAPPLLGHKPSGTRLLHSLASHYGQRGIGVVLSGMGEDGASGLNEIAVAGGTAIVQDEKSSVVYGMAREARALNASVRELPGPQIGRYLCDLFGLPCRRATVGGWSS